MSSSVMYYPGYSQTQVGMNLTWQVIASITSSFPMIVTTVNDHNYVAGMNVGFSIPFQFGMVELNKIFAQVLQLTPNTLSIDVDSTNFTPFSYPSPLPSAFTSPTVFPNSSGPYLPPQPLSYGNQDSFEGSIYNGGEI